MMMINIDDVKPTRLTVYINGALKYTSITMSTTFPWQQWLCKQATMLYVCCISCLISPFHTICTNYMGLHAPHVSSCSYVHGLTIQKTKLAGSRFQN